MNTETAKKKGCLAATFGLIGRMLRALGSTYANLWRKSKGWGKATLVLVPLLLCGLLGALGGGDSSTPPEITTTAQIGQAVNSTDTVTGTPAPTRTEAPTNTPKPTKTERPTKTPWPTRTSTNTPAPTATPSEAEAYFAAILPYVDSIDQANTNLSYLLQHPDFGDEEWVENLVAQMAIIQLGHQLITYQKPPDEVAHIHDAVLNVTRPLSEAMDEFAAGLAEGSAAKIDHAVALMEESQSAMPVFERLMDEHLESEDDAGSPPNAQEAAPADQDNFASGALGLAKASWEADHTQTGVQDTWPEYDDGKYLIVFMDEKVWHIERPFGGVLPDLAEARRDAASLMPDDSQLLETYSPEGFPELHVDRYKSNALAERFDSSLFTNGEPGEFIAVYGVFDGQVPRVVIGLGNNP